MSLLQAQFQCFTLSSTHVTDVGVPLLGTVAAELSMAVASAQIVALVFYRQSLDCILFIATA